MTTDMNWPRALTAGAEAAERASHDLTAMGRTGDVLAAALRAMAQEAHRQSTELPYPVHITMQDTHPPRVTAPTTESVTPVTDAL